MKVGGGDDDDDDDDDNGDGGGAFLRILVGHISWQLRTKRKFLRNPKKSQSYFCRPLFHMMMVIVSTNCKKTNVVVK